MKKYLAVIFAFTCINSSYAAEIEDVVLQFERPVFESTDIFCKSKNKNPLKENDFHILDYALMSSNQGHRYALVTIENTSTGQRILNNNHFAALLGNCEYTQPINLELKMGGNEIITTEINFGLHRFPIIQVFSQRK